ncbi:pyrimidine reductase family protein [Mycolicibacterium gilvum]|uniref:Pyrimidine reductase, riboflavin biosynthesis n=2 Tax=Mycolicibacterium gilvum TaxID=1804 RepID=E6TJ22_MYCSR|nr:pyrimidine reductase family protein [Mycolicibacterium gilvum]ABP44444.1 bifunctional deaminase-reductase domain protein [Mycolicibacterium gilvum PYR-GCK]ADT98045.1 pyrimidine reductase, riboflavin biosynthesis [Mycolicibacterium gilvum Spyr1]
MTEVRAISGETPVEDHGYRPAPPGLRANMIFSADGAAAFGGRAGPLSCPADYQLLLALRAYADVVLVGAGTARAESYGPVALRPDHRDQRRELGLGVQPPPLAVVSRSGRLPESIFAGPVPPILITSAQGAQECSEKRCQIVVSGDDAVDVAGAVHQLRSDGMERVLCEGGPTLLDELVTADLVDELCVTLAPRLAGSQPVGSGTPADIAAPAPMRLGRVLVDPDGYLFLTYRRA